MFSLWPFNKRKRTPKHEYNITPQPDMILPAPVEPPRYTDIYKGNS